MGTARADYEARWATLDASPASQPLQYASIPWLPGGARDEDGTYLRDMLLHGVQGPVDVKKRLRAEIMRWHPDKFVARFGPRLQATDRECVISRAKEMSQLVTHVMRGG